MFSDFFFVFHFSKVTIRCFFPIYSRSVWVLKSHWQKTALISWHLFTWSPRCRLCGFSVCFFFLPKGFSVILNVTKILTEQKCRSSFSLNVFSHLKHSSIVTACFKVNNACIIWPEEKKINYRQPSERVNNMKCMWMSSIEQYLT